MSISSLSATPTVRAAFAAAQYGPSAGQLEADRKALSEAGLAKAPATPGMPSPADVKKAASQFEAIILRQLLEPSLEPLMSGGLGGESAGGGGMYSYLLTDTLASNLAQGGGLGWARLLEKQLSPASAGADPSQPTSS
jgi:flagellar protein FlgJ